MNKTNPAQKASFKLGNLIDPFYIVKEFKSLASFKDLKKRTVNLFILLFKILTFRYGEGYWEKLRNKNQSYYLANLDNIGDLNVHFEMGKIFFELKDFKNAFRVFKRLLELDPKNSSAHFKALEINSMFGQDLLNAEELDKAINYNLDNEQAHRFLGDILNRKKQYEDALDAYKKALLLSKGDKEFESNIHNEMARLYFEQGNHGAVEQEIEKAISLYPENEYAHRFYGSFLKNKKENEKALAEFNKALAYYDGNKETGSNIYMETGQIYMEQAEYDQAQSSFIKALDLQPSNLKASMLLAKAFACSGKYNKALKLYNRATEISKDDRKVEEEAREGILDMLKRHNSSANNTKALAIDLNDLRVFKKADIKHQNMLNNELEIAGKELSITSNVRFLNVHLTNKCNIKCKMCHIPQSSFKDISLKVRDEIVNTFPCLEEIIWLGGEVFLYPDFGYLFDKAIEFNVKQHIVTNGLLINEEMAGKIVSNNVNLVLSIDGANKETYETIRQGACFKDVTDKLNMINRLRKRTNPLFSMVLNVVVMKTNYHQIESFVEFAREYNIGFIDYWMLQCPEADDYYEDIFIKNRDAVILSQVEKSFKNARELCSKNKIGCRVNIAMDLLKNDIKKDHKANGYEQTKIKAVCQNKTDCFAPWKSLSIELNGDVTPFAFALCGNVVGNLNEQSMKDVWNGDKLIKYRKQIVSGEIENMCYLTRYYKSVPYELLVH